MVYNNGALGSTISWKVWRSMVWTTRGGGKKKVFGKSNVNFIQKENKWPSFEILPHKWIVD